MLKSNWGKIGLATTALAVILMLPATSEAQRRGGGGGRGGSGGGGRGWDGGGRGWDGGGWNRGWGGSGFGIYLGSPYYGGYGYNRGYYGGYGYNDGWSSPSYYTTSPTYDYSSYYYAPTASTYSATDSYYNASQQVDPNTAMIHMRVPANAELFIDNTPTQQRGMERDFVSPPLDPNKNYSYNVRVRFTDANGQMVDRTRKVDVRAGAHINLDLMNETAGVHNQSQPVIQQQNYQYAPGQQQPANQINRANDANRGINLDRDQSRPDSTTNDPSRTTNPTNQPNSNQGITGQRPQ